MVGRRHTRLAAAATFDDRARPVLSATLLTLLLVGCTGGGQVDLIELQLRDLGEDDSLISTIHPDECYFTIDDDGFLNIGLRYRNVALFGPLSKISMDLSFELDEPPAGHARQYILRSRNMRGRIVTGAMTHRLKSTNGVISVWMESEDRIRCRFRIAAQRQIFSMLTGWQRGTSMLLLGDFVAVRNADGFNEINEVSQSEGWPRPPRRTVPLVLDHPPNAPTTSQPAGETSIPD